MLRILRKKTASGSDLLLSELYDEATFYKKFTKDINNSFHEVIIESPFITNRRLGQLLPIFVKLKSRKVRLVISTRDPSEQDNEYLRNEAHETIAELQRMGVQVLYTAGHHRKLAIIDRHILYEGSLNILSQNSSCEVMRRIESAELSWQMARFVKIDKFLN